MHVTTQNNLCLILDKHSQLKVHTQDETLGECQKIMCMCSMFDTLHKINEKIQE